MDKIYTVKQTAKILEFSTKLYIFGKEESIDGESWTRVGLSDSDADKNWFLRSDFLE